MEDESAVGGARGAEALVLRGVGDLARDGLHLRPALLALLGGRDASRLRIHFLTSGSVPGSTRSSGGGGRTRTRGGGERGRRVGRRRDRETRSRRHRRRVSPRRPRPATAAARRRERRASRRSRERRRRRHPRGGRRPSRPRRSARGGAPETRARARRDPPPCASAARAPSPPGARRPRSRHPPRWTPRASPGSTDASCPWPSRRVASAATREGVWRRVAAAGPRERAEPTRQAHRVSARAPAPDQIGAAVRSRSDFIDPGRADIVSPHRASGAATSARRPIPPRTASTPVVLHRRRPLAHARLPGPPASPSRRARPPPTRGSRHRAAHRPVPNAETR